MFKLVASPTYWWPVQVRSPSAERPGEYDVQQFEAQFRRLDVEDYDALMKRVADEQLSDRQFVPLISTGLRHIVDEHGVELPYTSELLERLLRVATVATCIARAFITSREPAAEKN